MTFNFLRSKKLLFDTWAPTYDWLFPSVIYQAIHQRLLEYVNLPERANILDMGCGTGRLLNRLTTKFPHVRGTGLDLSSEMLRIARMSNRHHPRLIYIEGKAECLPFAEGQFDAVFSTISFLHYLQPEQVLTEVKRVLTPGGHFYLVDITTKQQTGTQLLPISPRGIRLYSSQQREILGSSAGLLSVSHHYLLGPVLLTIFAKPA
ncbi:class I SAM-dependent methyltransferase [Umezakia ovalisporum]|uniref:Class I SAM-dependent methyltransferase n=2 Tax=Umezakia ovalisporum TaxID=75695 RepID=A0AA43KEN1_9CYAN|nr:class I SAM-dependent methyltransferase [Umezakia ovalisporum]MDH6058740.1 class I SAM-dependent methyltransferase [Umezakia ovalisporum FSS-43]MDH6063687.1 class I SAM-dependent methyltransferase [Umezakia ovalisporum FSS-62]MDH6066606.1 class I SAM-dependent methyltransferase [Umezakia ovalisporum APH033B]MDH6072254.1 class I SAM-dependent methyltransferase [Umezakia ovalisporum CobakiLakeA]MDH6072836.1 class I SAM-dependent methyltransferase [Umezakia ovalisporum CS-1034]